MAEAEKVYELVEVSRNTGKIKKGSNEVTKVLEKGQAKAVIVAKDISPPEITMHLPILAKEKGIPCFEVPSKDELGAAAGLNKGAAAIAIVQEGDAKKTLAELSKEE